MSIRVSICIPAYNQPHSLRRALDSVADQSFQDYEVVITDDSTDDAVARVASAYSADPRFRYYRNATRQGTPGNWNEAIRLAKAPLIKLLHHDDWFSHPTSLETFVRLLEEHPSANFAFCASLAHDSTPKLLFTHRANPAQLAELKQDPTCLFWCNFVGAPSATIFRMSGAPAFDAQLKWLVDIDFYMAVLKANPAFVFTEEPLVSITSDSSVQVSAACRQDPALQLKEYFYLRDKMLPLGVSLSRSIRFIRLLLSLLGMRNARAAYTALQSHEFMKHPPWEMRVALVADRLRWPIRTGIALLRKLRKYRFELAKFKPRQSYSQCGEDLIVDFIFKWLKIGNVRYLDIGAHHPTWLSNTYLMYRQGASGVLVEPDPDLFGKIRRHRPRDTCINAGVGLGSGSEADFYVMSTRTLNTFSREEALRYQDYGTEKIEKTIKIALIPVNDLIARHFSACPNFVSLDVEGLDLQILKDFDFDRFRPEVFCVETLTYTQNNTETKLTALVELMKAKGYFVYADTYINTIFVDEAAWSRR